MPFVEKKIIKHDCLSLLQNNLRDREMLSLSIKAKALAEGFMYQTTFRDQEYLVCNIHNNENSISIILLTVQIVHSSFLGYRDTI